MELKRKIKILNKFMSNQNIEGICSFWIDEEPDEYDNIWLYIVLDIDWINEIPTKPEFIVNRMRQGLREEIKKYLGV